MTALTRERLNGDAVRKIITDQGLDSIRPRSVNLEQLSGINKIVVVGSSSVGKSTIETFTRGEVREDPSFTARVDIPSRVVTRARRPDDGDDIYHATIEQLAEMRKSGSLGLYGVKLMEGDRQEPYGYTGPVKGKLPIYFANNQTVRNSADIEPSGFLAGALVGLIYTPDDIRERRLRERSPHLFIDNPDEVAFRLSDIERSIRLAGRVHFIVKNWGSNMERAPQDVASLIRELAIRAA